MVAAAEAAAVISGDSDEEDTIGPSGVSVMLD